VFALLKGGIELSSEQFCEVGSLPWGKTIAIYEAINPSIMRPMAKKMEWRNNIMYYIM